MLENKKTEVCGIHYSRFIASWKNVGGQYYGIQFGEWLKELGCTEQEIRDIREMATCGKYELELTAESFVNDEKWLIRKIVNGEEPD